MVKSNKKISLFAMILFTIGGIVGLDAFAASTLIGYPAITLWIVTFIFFFIPYGLVNAELGATYPDDGGIYAWVKNAFGEFHATLVGWFYWVNVAFWLPALYLLAAEWFAYGLGLEFSLTKLIIIAIVLCWITVYFGIRGIGDNQFVTNFGAIIKTIAMLLFGILGIIYASRYGLANPISINELIPSLDVSFVYTPSLIFSLLGFELISSVARDLENPKRDIPRMTVYSGLVVAVLYILATLGLLFAVPLENVDALTGVRVAFEELTTLFGSYGPIISRIIVGILIIPVVSMGFSWAAGATEVLGTAGLDKKAPGLLGHRHKKYGTADYSLYVIGVLSTLILVIFMFVGNDEAADTVFWTILAFSFVIFIAPYAWLFPAAIVSRYKDKDIDRPYRVPLGNRGFTIMAIIAEIFVVSAIVLLFFPDPAEYESVGLYYATLIIGTLITVILGLVIYINGQKREKEK